jgi:hypothetical protein
MISRLARRAMLVVSVLGVATLAAACSDSSSDGGSGATVCEDTTSSCPEILSCPDQGVPTCACPPAQETVRCRYSLVGDQDCSGSVVCVDGRWVDDGTVVEDGGW